MHLSWVLAGSAITVTVTARGGDKSQDMDLSTLTGKKPAPGKCQRVKEPLPHHKCYQVNMATGEKLPLHDTQATALRMRRRQGSREIGDDSSEQGSALERRGFLDEIGEQMRLAREAQIAEAPLPARAIHYASQAWDRGGHLVVICCALSLIAGGWSPHGSHMRKTQDQQLMLAKDTNALTRQMHTRLMQNAASDPSLLQSSLGPHLLGKATPDEDLAGSSKLSNSDSYDGSSEKKSMEEKEAKSKDDGL